MCHTAAFAIAATDAAGNRREEGGRRIPFSERAASEGAILHMEGEFGLVGGANHLALLDRCRF